MAKQEIKNLTIEEKIEKWKESYGGVSVLPVEDKKCYLREPNMRDYTRAFTVMQDQGDSAFGDEMLQSLWLEGDKEILTDNDYFAPAKKEIMKMLRYDDPIINELPDRQKEIIIGGSRAVIRVITKEDVSIAERKNPSNKPFVTQSALFDLVKVEADPAFDDKQNPAIRFPLYQALEKAQNTKIAQLKKL
ncbi:MAG TPA: hypothetical protein DCQ50_14750 [Chryseobacterium sp.]|nr:hypothetical protein [Chryseobacterium sp.]